MQTCKLGGIRIWEKREIISDQGQTGIQKNSIDKVHQFNKKIGK